ncbi:hypothetical protein SAMN05216226_10771 [Halovenus aranensis]|uniref:4-vinyl reductase 4VR domain-containing protein n=1 Tax=Halovenus aranensis TaxID=890420 RepID=A0A1G8VPL5_9EURY|nr:hypothetical protein [Halovenus aranensis]SDJ67884.1 hypothetical protein SAMN05216226_10771 [Halovenus aranensis]
MSKLNPYEEGVEAKGAAVLSFINGVPAPFRDKARTVLASHGIEDIEPDSWYSQQSYLNAFEHVVEEMGDATLQEIAKSTPENAEWPPDVETPAEALDSIDDAYHMNHRGGDIGYYEVEEHDDRTVIMECKTPYPCDYDKALVKRTAELFSDEVIQLTEVGDQCRADGGEQCRYEVTW